MILDNILPRITVFETVNDLRYILLKENNFDIALIFSYNRQKKNDN